MNRDQRGDRLIPVFTLLVDSAAIEISFLFSYWLRFQSPFFTYLGFVEEGAPPFSGYLISSFAVTLLWLLLFNARKMYGARRSVMLADELINIVRVVSLGMLIIMSVAFFYREFSYSRVVFVLLWISSTTFLFIGRCILQWYERRLYRRGKHLQDAIIIGGNGLANEVYVRLNGHPSFGFRVIGYFAHEESPRESSLGSARYLGPFTAVPQFIKENEITLAFIALQSKDHPWLFDLISECEGINIDFMMVPDVLDVLTSQVRVKELEGIPFLKLKGIPFTFWGRILKRGFDVTIASILLVILSPLLLLLALGIKLTSKGPVLFLQERVSLGGEKFKMYKFRSMKVGSEELDDHAGLGVKHDPRRTRFGVFMRKTSLDELPQLFNVLRGEMSLVGPRPERISYVRQFEEAIPKYIDRHRVKTGVTGWAQVNGLRGDTSIEERIKYDLYYIENWSVAFDIKILLRTLRAALSTKGVH